MAISRFLNALRTKAFFQTDAHGIYINVSNGNEVHAAGPFHPNPIRAALNDVDPEPAATPASTIGDLTPNDIGNTELCIRHEGSTVTGTLMHMHIATETREDPILCSPDRNLHITHVGVTLVLGPITVGPLSRSHTVEVIA